MPPTSEVWVCGSCDAVFPCKGGVKSHFRAAHPPQVPSEVYGRLSDSDEDMEDWLQLNPVCKHSWRTGSHGRQSVSSSPQSS